MTIKEIWEHIGEIGMKQDDAILWHGYKWAKDRGPIQQTEMLLRLVELQREDRKRLLDECTRLTAKAPLPPIIVHSTKEGILWRGRRRRRQNTNTSPTSF